MAMKTQKTAVYFKKDDSTLVKVGAVTDAGVVGGGRSQIDVTDLDSDEMEYLPGLANPGAIAVQLNLDMADSTHEDLETLFADGTSTTWIVALSDGAAAPTISTGTITFPNTRTYIEFTGYIADLPIGIAKNDVLRTPMQVQRSGARTIHRKA